MVGVRTLDKTSLFEGSFQILYGPYVALLTPRPNLPEVHVLLALCKFNQRSRLFKWFGARARRNRRAAIDEARELHSAIRKSKKLAHRWKHEFLDFLAVALGLLQEAMISHDAAGVQVWRGLLLGPELAFQSWPHCSQLRQQEMSEIVRNFAQVSTLAPYDIPNAFLSYYDSYVRDRKSSNGMELPNLVGLYMSIRNGSRSDFKTENAMYRLAFSRLRLPHNDFL